MITTPVNPRYLMGRIRDFDNFDRLTLNTRHNKHHGAVLKYCCGVFFCFKCDTVNLSITYRAHFGKDNFIMSKRLKTELICMGRNGDKWEMINIPYQFLKKDGFVNDDLIQIDYKLFGNKYDEFQVCLPPCGRVSEITLKTDNPVEFIKIPNTHIFLGSSIAQDCNVAAHTNFCCMSYRKYGINMATVGISGYNSLMCPDLIKYLSLPFFNDKEIILMDNIHSSINEFESMMEALPNVKIAIVNNVNRKEFKELLFKHPEIKNNVINIDGNGRQDDVHLNPIGSNMYLNNLKSKNLI